MPLWGNDAPTAAPFENQEGGGTPMPRKTTAPPQEPLAPREAREAAPEIAGDDAEGEEA